MRAEVQRCAKWRIRARRSGTIHGRLLAAGALSTVALAGCGGGGKAPSATSTSTPATTGRGTVKLPPPMFAQSINLQPVSGTVRVKLPTSAGFVPLSAARQVLVGTAVDVRTGAVKLTAAYPSAGQFAVGDFHAGVFEITQNRAGRGLTELRIQDTESERTACAGARGASHRSTPFQLGLLLGDAKGRFRTEGEFSAATVRGTKWGVRDRCDGTLTIVRRGVMVVTDFRLHKNVLLHAGQKYLAKAP